ncbi:YdcF family protein [Aphanothece sacrum]|uniref:Membrane protein n=1 Tax=Aphanothece sacrum FPU1 TaxID=1920663 RepID=A0A401IFK1_APHSA|nr:YdcF family protein [Aphanothece sacrum]GBF80001.1 membrane protein [Aphanothece sacrum FPU1]GBF83779.1 membrane protein [Aphanothece sacrum FPU3]
MSFLFLSKLIPLFFYPLGLVTVLLIVTLFLAWRKSSKLQIPLALALIIILISSNGWVSNELVKSLEWQYLNKEEIPQAEAIIILGGATKSATFPRPMVDVNEQGDRVIYAAKLYQDKKAPLIIASGGRIDWLGGQEPEAKDMTQLLQLMGVPQTAVIQESESLNTYENAINVNKILEEKHINEVLLVTSALHMPRSLAIFKKQGINVIPAPTDFLISEADLRGTNISFGAVIFNLLPEASRLAKTTQALKEYLGIIIYRLQGWL